MRATHGQRIAELRVGQCIVIEKIPAGGSLEARKLSSGPVMFYWRHTRAGDTERLPKSLQPTHRGYSVSAALEAARDTAKLDQETPGGMRAERDRVAAARAAENAARELRQRFTLKALCAEYVEWLKAQGKTSWRDAENIFDNHVASAFPDLVEKPAAEVQKSEIVAALRRPHEAGKKTTARKLRAYLRAAYACAVKADSDPTLPKAFADFQVHTNPVESIAAGKVQSAKNPLAPPDLRKYWRALQDEPGVIGAALRLHVLTGGQRTAQLVRVQRSALAGGTLPLLDPKGKRTEPREHLLPITKRIGIEFAALPARGFLFSTDGGKTPMHPTSISKWASDVAERSGMENFQLKRVRSGIETMLAAAGVTKHIRGQLQSHGIGGVQDQHYDAHEYLPEKRKAMDLLLRLLEKQSVKGAEQKLRHSAAQPLPWRQGTIRPIR
jgi:hypothetical protein